MSTNTMPSDAEITSRATRVHEILESLDGVASYTESNGAWVGDIEPVAGVTREQVIAAINERIGSLYSLRDVYAHEQRADDVRVQLFAPVGE